jgi:hypothetical protein
MAKEPKVTKKIRTAFLLTPLAIKRIGAACVAESMNQSELIEMLVHERLNGYGIQQPRQADRIGQPKSAALIVTEDRLEIPGGVNLSATSAA